MSAVTYSPAIKVMAPTWRAFKNCTLHLGKVNCDHNNHGRLLFWSERSVLTLTRLLIRTGVNLILYILHQHLHMEPLVTTSCNTHYVIQISDITNFPQRQSNKRLRFMDFSNGPFPDLASNALQQVNVKMAITLVHPTATQSREQLTVCWATNPIPRQSKTQRSKPLVGFTSKHLLNKLVYQKMQTILPLEDPGRAYWINMYLLDLFTLWLPLYTDSLKLRRLHYSSQASMSAFQQ